MESNQIDFMKPTKEQIAEMIRRESAHTYEVWQIRNAAKTNNTWSEHHPENIRRRIAEARALLNEALLA